MTKKGNEYQDVLKHEFNAEEGSFLIELRPGLEWDKKALSRLVAAMEICCKECEKKKSLPRWLATGFFYVPSFVKDWSSHPNFPRIHPEKYYERAYRRLDDLAYWFFFGESPYEKRHRLEPL